MRATSSEIDRVADRLTALLGRRVSTSDLERERHGRDMSYLPPQAPDVVCYPVSTEEVAEIVSLCAAYGVPIVPFGAGSSVEGNALSPFGGVCVDLSQMTQIVAVHAEDLDCTVQAGATRRQLNELLEGRGLFFPVDPGYDATLGGMAATRASGTNAVRYGTMRENVLALTAVLPDGRIIRTARRARKSAAGYDLTRLLVGSEGTLGIITEVTLRLYSLPEAVSAAVVSFVGIEGAVDAVVATIQAGIPIARIELLDEVQMDAVNRYAGLHYPAQPTLFLEFHGTCTAVKEQAERVGRLASSFGGSDFHWATEIEERTRLWQARHHAAYAALALRPNCRGWATDVCVPLSRLTQCILETKRDLAATSLIAPLVGHVGDGSFHLIILLDPSDPAELAEAERLNERLICRALAMDGTCTGEHGIGLGKRKYLHAEHGDAVDVMGAIKQALDPNSIMNPGKVLP